MTKVLVLGATGQTGRKVTECLQARSAVDVIGASRRPHGSGGRAFDWNVPETWKAVLANVVCVYLVKPNAYGAVDVEATVASFLDDAKSVRRIVLLSGIAAETRNENLDERRVERLIETSRFEWTILRPIGLYRTSPPPSTSFRSYATRARLGCLLRVGQLRLSIPAT
ncbi:MULTISPECIES: SDR family oxidoreductase [Rhizobiaceae]|uniref:SDR family oxidoreductase n=1 Tax=Rhizobiaceae TaxID=82115 RepID=UPI003CFE2B35